MIYLVFLHLWKFLDCQNYALALSSTLFFFEGGADLDCLSVGEKSEEVAKRVKGKKRKLKF